MIKTTRKNKEAEKQNYYRRCHVCNHVTTSDEPVTECSCCKKVMAPFFFFDVKKTKIYSDIDDPFLQACYSAITSSDENEKEKRQPIEGLTVYW